LNGKLPLQDVNVTIKSELKFTEIDCQIPLMNDKVEEDDENFNEILAEIFAEEK